ncbi:MAG: MHFG family PEP-CTERM protein [Burkholderiales bacterium]|nr:MHFG family PEP-CTERM protein [Burkholderiales bacterium]
MSTLIAATALLATTAAPSCSWDSPGRDAFRGDVVAAVDYYRDIPPDTRARLKARMARHAYDEVADIRRDRIEGRHEYVDLRDMHFGRGGVCRQVSRQRWTEHALERGLVYCEDGHCLIVPTVCGNLSRVTRVERPEVATARAEQPDAAHEDGPPRVAQQADDGAPLEFEPPGAGPAAGPSFQDGAAPAPAGGGAGDMPGQPAAGNPDGSGARPWGPIAGPGPWDPGPRLDIVPVIEPPPPPIPEPGTALLWLGGLAALAASRRWQRARSRSGR